MRSASAVAVSASASKPSLPGTMGIPAAAISRRACSFSPISRNISGDGPMKVILEASQTSAKFAFSERKPYPG